MNEDAPLWSRVKGTWHRTFDLSWPVAADNFLRTFMRTTDIIVTGFFSPAAITALGLADIYGRIPLAIGQGFGSGAIALSSQESGTNRAELQNESITQALLFGALLGVPLMFFGLIFGVASIRILGATETVAVLSGQYLALIFMSAPARHVGYIGARSLQGIGNTRTPMAINICANFINIALTFSLGLGLWLFPQLGIVGVGIGTAMGNAAAALLVLAYIYRDPGLSIKMPRNFTVTKQLIVISSPKVFERLSTTGAEFPFNSILLGISVEANAAWQVGRRVFQQVVAPFLRAFNVASSVITGQTLGSRDFNNVHFYANSILGLGILTMVPLSIVMIVAANHLVWIFTDDQLTAMYAIQFTVAYGFLATLEGIFRILGGALQGGGETRKPFIAEITGVFGGLVGLSYLFVVHFEMGVLGAVLGITGFFVWRGALVFYWYSKRNWIQRAGRMMDSRSRVSTRD